MGSFVCWRWVEFCVEDVGALAEGCFQGCVLVVVFQYAIHELIILAFVQHPSQQHRRPTVLLLMVIKLGMIRRRLMKLKEVGPRLGNLERIDGPILLIHIEILHKIVGILFDHAEMELREVAAEVFVGDEEDAVF